MGIFHKTLKDALFYLEKLDLVKVKDIIEKHIEDIRKPEASIPELSSLLKSYDENLKETELLCAKLASLHLPLEQTKPTIEKIKEHLNKALEDLLKIKKVLTSLIREEKIILE